MPFWQLELMFHFTSVNSDGDSDGFSGKFSRRLALPLPTSLRERLGESQRQALGPSRLNPGRRMVRDRDSESLSHRDGRHHDDLPGRQARVCQ
jgi:hypothetical protein